MSGPKISRYSLSAELVRVLEEQRGCELRLIIANEKINGVERRTSYRRKWVVEQNITVQSAPANDIPAEDTSREALLSQVDSLLSRIEVKSVTSPEKTSETEGIVSQTETIPATNEATPKEELHNTIGMGATPSFGDAVSSTFSQSSLQREEVLKQLEQLDIDILPQALKTKIYDTIQQLDLITDPTYLKNFIAVRVNPLIKQVDRIISEYEECQTEFESLYSEYVALCKMYSYVAQKYECSHAGIQSLRTELARINQVASKEDEQAYISDSLDKVMQEMGYSVLGTREVKKRNGKHFRNKLYSFEEGTAVNVTYSSDGKIAMELAGLDTCDRIPTSEETDILCESMEKFCDDFKKIEKQLQKKGIILVERVSLLPPDADYAQIINTSDYTMETQPENLQTRQSHHTSPKQKKLRMG